MQMSRRRKWIEIVWCIKILCWISSKPTIWLYRTIIWSSRSTATATREAPSSSRITTCTIGAVSNCRLRAANAQATQRKRPANPEMHLTFNSVYNREQGALRKRPRSWREMICVWLHIKSQIDFSARPCHQKSWVAPELSLPWEEACGDNRLSLSTLQISTNSADSTLSVRPVHSLCHPNTSPTKAEWV